jgi:hypothetical protein
MLSNNAVNLLDFLGLVNIFGFEVAYDDLLKGSVTVWERMIHIDIMCDGGEADFEFKSKIDISVKPIDLGLSTSFEATSTGKVPVGKCQKAIWDLGVIVQIKTGRLKVITLLQSHLEDATEECCDSGGGTGGGTGGTLPPPPGPPPGVYPHPPLD